MDCPACHEPLVVLEFEHVEVDYCLACKGVWLDAGELALLAEEASGSLGTTPPPAREAQRHERRRRCPACRAWMRKASTSGPGAITYDWCPNGDGQWFDEGELDCVIRGGDSGSPGRLASFLRDVFAMRAKEGGPG